MSLLSAAPTAVLSEYLRQKYGNVIQNVKNNHEGRSSKLSNMTPEEQKIFNVFNCCLYTNTDREANVEYDVISDNLVAFSNPESDDIALIDVFISTVGNLANQEQYKNDYKLWLNQNLLFASMGGHIYTVRYLIELGADVNAIDNISGETALMKASEAGQTAMVELLLSKGASVSIDTRDETKETALIKACRNNNIDAARLLIDSGANANLADKYEITALMWAINNRCQENISALMGHADVNKSDKYGKTPLMIASQHNNLPAVKKLLYEGADVTARDDHGKTALDLVLAEEDTPEALHALMKKNEINGRCDHIDIIFALIARENLVARCGQTAEQAVAEENTTPAAPMVATISFSPTRHIAPQAEAAPAAAPMVATISSHRRRVVPTQPATPSVATISPARRRRLRPVR